MEQKEEMELIHAGLKDREGDDEDEDKADSVSLGFEVRRGTSVQCCEVITSVTCGFGGEGQWICDVFTSESNIV